MVRRSITRLGAVAAVAALVLSLGASTVLAGEITGNGKVLKLEDGGKWGTGLHARSFCAYSGQEDLQFDPGEPGSEIQIDHVPHVLVDLCQRPHQNDENTQGALP